MTDGYSESYLKADELGGTLLKKKAATRVAKKPAARKAARKFLSLSARKPPLVQGGFGIDHRPKTEVRTTFALVRTRSAQCDSATQLAKTRCVLFVSLKSTKY